MASAGGVNADRWLCGGFRRDVQIGLSNRRLSTTDVNRGGSVPSPQLGAKANWVRDMETSLKDV